MGCRSGSALRNPAPARRADRPAPGRLARVPNSRRAAPASRSVARARSRSCPGARTASTKRCPAVSSSSCSALGVSTRAPCAFADDAATSSATEERRVARTAERAGIEEAMSILDLGCGCGSSTLGSADRLPNARIVAVSNSASQRRAILERAADRGLQRLGVTTTDVNARPQNFASARSACPSRKRCSDWRLPASHSHCELALAARSGGSGRLGGTERRRRHSPPALAPRDRGDPTRRP